MDGLDRGQRPGPATFAADGNLFASVFQHAPTGMAVAAPDGMLLEVNPAFCAMAGLDRGDLLGAHLTAISHPADRETLSRLLRRLARRELPTVETTWRFPGSGTGDARARLSLVAAGFGEDEAGGHIVIQAQDITAERAAEQDRLLTERRFRAFIEEVPAAIFLVPMDKSLSPAYISPQVERITGYTPDDLMTDRDFLLPLVHPDDRAAFLAENERSDTTLEPFEAEVRVRHRDGHWVWISSHSTVTRSPAGVPTGWQGVIVDITATRSAQDRLRAAQRMYGALVSTIPAIAYRCAPDALGQSRYEYLSPQASLMLGYDLDTLLEPGTFQSLIHPDDQPGITIDTNEALQNGQVTSLYRIRSADGRWLWLRDETVLIRDEFGTPLSWHGVAFDITAEKQAANRIAEAEARYHAIVDNIPAFTYVMHPGAIRTWRFSYLSPKLEAILGYPSGSFPREGASQDAFFDRLIHPDDLAVMNAAIDHQLEGGSDRIVDFYRLRAADGSWRWIRDEAVLIRDDAGKPLYWHAAGMDVTTEREAERRVAEAVTRYRRLVENLQAAVLISDSVDSDRIRYASPGAERLFGTDARTITADPDFLARRIHPEDWSDADAATTKAFAAGSPWTGEVRIRGENDHWIWVRADVRLVQDDTGRPIHWQALLLDLTELKSAAAALAERESIFRAVFERGGVAINLTDPDENIIAANPAFCDFLGYTREELLTMNFRGIAHPEDLPADAALHKRLLAAEIDGYRIEMRYRRKDGSWTWGLAAVTLVRDADGAFVCTLGQVQDISGRRRAEAALAERESIFRGAFDHAPVGMALADPDGRIIDANPFFCAMLGIPRERFAGLSYADITAEEDVEPNRQRLTLLQQGELDRFTLAKRYRRPDGSEFPGRLSVSAVRDDAGRLVRIISQVEDLSEQATAERDRTHSEDRLRALVENAPDTIMLTDVDGIIRWATPSARNLFGRPLEEMLGRHGGMLVHPDDVATLTMLGYDAMKAPGQPVTGEVRLSGPGGEWRWAQVIFTDHFLTPGIGGLVANLRDITDRKRTELAMAEANRLQGKALADLRDTNLARQDFLSFLNHEFRTPLTGISGYAQLLAQGSNAEEDVRRFSGIITREAGRLTSMVSDLLLLDRAERGDLPFEPVDVPIAAIVDERIIAATPLWPDRQVAVDLAPGLAAAGDSSLIGQAIANLIDNALRYSPGKSTVRVAARRNEGMVHLIVQDEGFGIPVAHLDRVFDRFHRVRDGQARFVPGNGLGLTVVRAIATLHGGRVWAEPADGGGSALHLMLPSA